jgi:hypothetical protein
MASYVLTNPLALFNLKESPYFQDALQSDGRYPISLFVGREDAAEKHLRKIMMNPGGTRQTIRGKPGIGKSTLAQYVKTEAAKQFNLLTVSAPISLSAAADADQVCAQILRAVIEALLLGAEKNGTDVSQAHAIREASQLVRVYQVTTGVGGGASAFGFGGNISTSDTLVTPPAAKPSIVIPSLLPALMEIATKQLKANGILLHLNNLENLSEEDAARAATILRDIRDTVLMKPHYHWLVVGTEDAVMTVVDSVTQLRTHFERPPALKPLTDAEVAALLDKRYTALRADQDKPFRHPIEAEAVSVIYTIYGGDLRAAFAAMDAAITQRLGTSAKGAKEALTLDDVLPFLIGWTTEAATTHLGDVGVAHLIAIAKKYGTEPFTRGKMQEVTALKNDVTARDFLATLLQLGYIGQHSELRSGGRGRPASQYVITGPTRLLSAVQANT